QAHAVLDAVRAAAQVSGSGVTSTAPVALAGYSQGGGAAAAAAELASDYAPELDLKGAYVGAPPADLVQVADRIDGG
ncbi:lipase family protein, partial [Streptococcus anginosus]|nr:lipase family protein [Streptococcus anginosus]